MIFCDKKKILLFVVVVVDDENALTCPFGIIARNKVKKKNLFIYNIVFQIYDIFYQDTN